MRKVNCELTIRRGNTRQVNVISTGDMLDSSVHRRERVGTIGITNTTDGRVVVTTQDIAFALHTVRPSTGSWSYRREIARDSKVRLLATSRDGGKWVIDLGNTGNVIEIEIGVGSGSALTVRHITERVDERRAAA